MGGSSFNPGHFRSFASAKVTGKATSAVFTARSMKESLDPKLMKNMMRESCDDDVCPNSTAIIVGLDQTGSMGMIPDYMIREGMPKLFQEIIDRKPVPDPHLMFMGIGDAETGEDSPIQISQFEAGIRIADQLKDMHLVGMGGGNQHESYTFPWYMAAMHTKIDCWEKRQKKGYLFTVGDEYPNPILTRAAIKKNVGVDPEIDFTAKQLLDMVSKNYHVFHIIVEQGSAAQRNMGETLRQWQELLGQRTLVLSDYTKLSEVITSAIQVIEGDTIDKVVDSWSGDTSLVVSKAIKDLAVGSSGKSAVVRF
jgi:hypothetical protein